MGQAVWLRTSSLARAEIPPFFRQGAPVRASRCRGTDRDEAARPSSRPLAEEESLSGVLERHE